MNRTATLLPPPPWMTIRPGIAPCVTNPDLYQRLSDDVAGPQPTQSRRQQSTARRKKRAVLMDRLGSAASSACAACPLFDKCLFDAVTGDIHGFVAATEPADRARIRRMLNVTPARGWVSDAEAGVSGAVSSKPRTDRDQIAILLAEHPDWTMSEIARRVGCSPHTVSRHKRRLASADMSRPTGPKITPARVRAAYDTLLEQTDTSTEHAA